MTAKLTVNRKGKARLALTIASLPFILLIGVIGVQTITSCSSDGDDGPSPAPASSSSGVSSSSGGPSSSSSPHTHVWGEWAVTTAPTCGTEGVETRTCASDASHTETQPKAKLTYTEGTQRCENDVIETKCGSGWYNAATQFCQDGTNAVKDLCGAKSYTSAQFCHGGKVGSFCGGREQTYDPDKYECKASINPDGIYLKAGITDARNDKDYNAVLIGGQTWMAGNLNYAPADGNSWCYDSDDDNCGTYGRLYDWAAAMDGSVSSTENPSGVQGVCPSGWHLPSKAEWDALATYIEGDKECSDCDAKHLKADSGLWNGGTRLDSYGFSALPGGNYNDGNFYNAGISGYWWSASENNANVAYYRIMYYHNENAYWNLNDKSLGFSVRCLQD